MDFAGKLEGALSTLEGSLMKVSNKFESLAEPMAKYVEALEPGQMQLFGMAMRDLNATIGVAFLPAMEKLTQGASQAANILEPATKALAPVFGSLASAIKDLMLVSLERMSAAMVKASPLLTALADGAQVLVTVWDTIMGALTGGQGFANVIKTLSEWVTKLVGAIVVAVATLANTLGATGFAGNLAKNLRAGGKERAEGGAGEGLNNFAIKGLEQISKDLTIAAQYAAGGGEEQKDPNLVLMENIAKQLEEVAKNGTTFAEWLGLKRGSSLSDVLITVLKLIINGMLECLEKGFNGLKNATVVGKALPNISLGRI